MPLQSIPLALRQGAAQGKVQVRLHRSSKIVSQGQNVMA
jgi:hypothetical protein